MDKNSTPVRFIHAKLILFKIKLPISVSLIRVSFVLAIFFPIGGIALEIYI